MIKLIEPFGGIGTQAVTSKKRFGNQVDLMGLVERNKKSVDTFNESEQHYSHNNTHAHSNTTDRLYHKDVYLPDRLIDLCRKILKDINVKSLILDNHVLNNINSNTDGDSHDYTIDDIIGAVELAKKRVDTLNIFEVGVNVVKDEDDKKFLVIKKMVFRLPLDSELDICIVLYITKNNAVKVKTAWINKHDDNHKVGFNSSRYYRPKNFVEPPKDEPKKKKVVIIRKKKPTISEKDFEDIYNKGN